MQASFSPKNGCQGNDRGHSQFICDAQEDPSWSLVIVEKVRGRCLPVSDDDVHVQLRRDCEWKATGEGKGSTFTYFVGNVAMSSG